MLTSWELSWTYILIEPTKNFNLLSIKFSFTNHGAEENFEIWTGTDIHKFWKVENKSPDKCYKGEENIKILKFIVVKSQINLYVKFKIFWFSGSKSQIKQQIIKKN